MAGNTVAGSSEVAKPSLMFFILDANHSHSLEMNPTSTQDPTPKHQPHHTAVNLLPAMPNLTVLRPHFPAVGTNLMEDMFIW